MCINIYTYSVLHTDLNFCHFFAVNECLSENGGCDQMCEDTPLSFNCHCRNGFSLNTNGQSCDGNNSYSRKYRYRLSQEI